MREECHDLIAQIAEKTARIDARSWSINCSGCRSRCYADGELPQLARANFFYITLAKPHDIDAANISQRVRSKARRRAARRIQDTTYANAILDRLLHNAHRVELEGKSLRCTRASINDCS